MSTGIYSRNKALILLWLIPAICLTIFISLGIWITEKVVNGAEQELRLYTTALQTKNDTEFNYAIDTRQGNILTWATFESVDSVKFDEMNKSFMSVSKTKEVYTQHEREVCETHYRTETRMVLDEDGNYVTETYEVPYDVCRMETYYTWDWDGTEEKSVDKVKLAGRTYDKKLFSFSDRSIDASEIIKGQTGHYYYPEERFLNWFASEGDIRYYYRVTELKIIGSIFVNTNNGNLAAVGGGAISVSGTSVAARIKNIETSIAVKKWLFIIPWTLLTLVVTGFVAVKLYEFSEYA